MPLRRVVLLLVGLSLVVMETNVSAAGAAVSDGRGEITVDPRTGTATWTATLECNPGDWVEVDLFIHQGASEAFASVVELCGVEREVVLLTRTFLEDGSDPLHPGRADVTIQRRDQVPTGEDQYETVPSEQARFHTVLRPA